MLNLPRYYGSLSSTQAIGLGFVGLAYEGKDIVFRFIEE